MVQGQQQKSNQRSSSEGGGSKNSSSRNRNRSRRRRGRKKGRSGGPSQKGKNQQKNTKFKPERLVPLGAEPLPQKKLNVNRFKDIPHKSYGILVYETLQAAEGDLKNIAETSEKFDQLNVVIKAEGPRSHAEIDEHAKLFCGEAWHLIHQRRIEDGWYNEPQPLEN